MDDIFGGGLAAKHLIELGHRRIGVISGPQSIQPNAVRRNGFLQSLASSGVNVPDQMDLITEILRVEEGEAAGARLLDHTKPPSAVFCGNDLLAIGFLRAAIARGLRVPEDIAIIGYDDVVFAELASVPLTSVRQPIYDLGYSAAKLLLGRGASSPYASYLRAPTHSARVDSRTPSRSATTSCGGPGAGGA